MLFDILWSQQIGYCQIIKKKKKRWSNTICDRKMGYTVGDGKYSIALFNSALMQQLNC
jgi:hypothetical protein